MLFCIDINLKLVSVGHITRYYFTGIIWDRVFKDGPSEVCGQPLKNFSWSTLEYVVPFLVL